MVALIITPFVYGFLFSIFCPASFGVCVWVGVFVNRRPDDGEHAALEIIKRIEFRNHGVLRV